MARTTTESNPPKMAYKLREAAELTSFGYDKLRECIAAGRLKAKRDLDPKTGEPVGPFIILHRDLEDFLNALVDAA